MYDRRHRRDHVNNPARKFVKSFRRTAQMVTNAAEYKPGMSLLGRPSAAGFREHAAAAARPAPADRFVTLGLLKIDQSR